VWFGCDTENFITVVTPKMRRMQDTLQDRATFITFVNARNQRMINCDWYFTMIDTPSMGEYLHFLYFTNFNIKMIPCNFRAYVHQPKHSGISMGIYISKHEVNIY
jgi:hypothetical protein